MLTPFSWFSFRLRLSGGSLLPPPLSDGRGSFVAVLLVIVIACLAGCGTTRITDSRRTATEQLLVSGAIDRAIDQIDCTPLTGKSVYLGHDYYRPAEDLQYLIDTVRQKLLASGCTLKEKQTEADLVVNLRVGTIGTDSNRVIFGVPSVNVPPALAALSSTPMSIPTIPEVPLVTKQAQQGVAKIGLFAFDQKTGDAYWQSGAIPTSNSAKEVWVLGAGPWQWGSIYDQPKFAGGNMPLAGLWRKMPWRKDELDTTIHVASTATFFEPEPEVPSGDIESGKVQLASHTEPDKPDADEKPKGDAVTKPQVKPAPAAEKPATTTPATSAQPAADETAAAKAPKPIPPEEAAKAKPISAAPPKPDSK